MPERQNQNSNGVTVTSMPRVLVFDEHSVYRVGLRNLLSARIPHLEWAEADSRMDALAQMRTGAFELVIAGVNQSNGGLDLLKAAREFSPATRFVILSATDTRAEILAALAAGFHGFVSKHQSDAEIVAAISGILAGRIYVPWSLAEGSIPDVSPRGPNDGMQALADKAELRGLTNRQREVLTLLACGKSNKEIARALDIAEATTKIHMAALLRALGVRNRTEAAFKAGKLVNRAVPPQGPAGGASSSRVVR